jgi:hypothetical protein
LHHGKAEAALVVMSEGFEIEEHLNNSTGLRLLLRSLINILTRLGRHSEVIEYFDRAIVVTQNHPALVEQREAFVRSMSSSKKPLSRKSE